MIGVYYLTDKKEIVYIGQSIDIEDRIKQHKNSSKVFDDFHCVECKKEELDEFECNEIIKHKPKYNIRHLENNKKFFGDKVRLKTIKVPVDLWRKLKKMAFENETTIAYEVSQCYNALEQKNKKKEK